ncbi:COX15/CtaA family protein [Gilvimarinus agarilyticus]|uniref:COX15/CtaA family protein n=1 Tax=unclassified Gilvimarinus TaxID=2642066 RepID=UPI001C082EB5|nr:MULTISPECIES: COX15/CtaA family protein [unclassified Gilvimarinus]MBU2884269.1 COX15/CtaA family protein [Gilvimarinus agarilyticus]MDO6569408.1 COX15/CtaA family protein [Gilvimarinus sp. 2_MG-2023]MDO6747562.1 COX15/CtaA family protein [Gilvimarinus sp. 1_MG-2023]
MTNERWVWGFRIALLATALASLVVVLGAFTRLADAGLGCPDWPGCYGHLTWPTTADHVEAAEALFPESPVEHDKTWPEMVHRHFAGALGLLILGLTIVTWRKASKTRTEVPRWHTVGLLVLVIIQAAFGMWTVTLKLWPQIVTAHLLGGFATLSLLWLLVQRLGPWRWVTQQHLTLQSLKPLTVLALVLVTLQIALGGWTSSNYAALACTDFPTCHGQWWPEMDVVRGFNLTQTIGPNYLGGLLEGDARTAIHMAHRFGAIVVTLTLLLLLRRLLQVRVARPMGLVLATVLAAQITLGITNVMAHLPLAIAVAHNAVGALLLLCMVTLTHRVYTAKVAIPQ